jgi:hypothetical protein
VANALTENGADDAGEVPDLLEQVDGEIASFIADGAYDGEPVNQAVAGRQHDPPADVVIPPRAAAMLSTDTIERQSQGDRHIRFIAEKGRMGGKRRLVTADAASWKRPLVDASNRSDRGRELVGWLPGRVRS